MNDLSKVPTATDYLLAVLNQMVMMRPMLEPAFKHSLEGHNFDDAFRLVASGKCIFFWNSGCCTVMEWRDYPSGKTLFNLWSGGKYKSLLELYDVVEGFAKANGAVAIATLGREGFRKRLPKEGWRIAGTFFYKEICK